MYEFAVTPAVTQLRRQGVTITAVLPGSLGEELGLCAADRIIRVNGRPVRDYLDFRFQTAGETELDFQVKKAGGETHEIEFDRIEGEDFGLEFEQIIPRQCANECIFCFCKGNPADARPSLFVRDEDIRLSFLYGNYTTLTSITDDEMRRILEQRLSPQYVSVHATDIKTRAFLLGVDESRADISDKMRRLLDNGIEIHAQIVLCPEVNDGEILEKTLRDLAAEFPRVASVAVVPVALTRYNNDERLTRVSPEFCRKVIRDVSEIQREFRSNLGTTFAFLGDEIYLKAGAEIPSRRHYGNYPQIEDGVGMIRTFIDGFNRLLKHPDRRPRNSGKSVGQANIRTHRSATVPKRNHPSGFSASDVNVLKSLNGTILTGEMFAPILGELIGRFNRKRGAKLNVLSVGNTYFGGDVAVAGLLTGQDFLAARDNVTGDFAIVPLNTIKQDDGLMLDGMKFSDMQSRFDMPVYAMDTTGLFNFLSGGLN